VMEQARNKHAGRFVSFYFDSISCSSRFSESSWMRPSSVCAPLLIFGGGGGECKRRRVKGG
jgi:hypothetical protein